MIALVALGALVAIGWRLVLWRRGLHEEIEYLSAGWRDERLRGRRDE